MVRSRALSRPEGAGPGTGNWRWLDVPAILGPESMPHITLPIETLEALGITDGELLDVALTAEKLAMTVAWRLAPVLVPRGFDVTRVIRVLVFGGEKGILLTQ